MKRLAGGLTAVVLALAAAAPASAVEIRTLVAEGHHPVISSDGSQVFLGTNADLVPADENANGFDDEGGGFFRIDVATGAAQRMARAIPSADGKSVYLAPLLWGSMSADGSTIAGDAQRNYVTPGPDSGDSVMTATHGGPGERVLGPYGSASPPRVALSRDGAHVAWDEYVGGRYNLYYDGIEVSSSGFEPTLSDDGRFLAYTAQSGERTFRVHVRDMKTGRDRIASSDGRNRAGIGYGAQISGNGRYVAFRSPSVLVPGAKNWLHVYRKDLKTNRVRVATLTAKEHLARGLEAKFIDPFGGGDVAKISTDGRYIAFLTRAPLAKGDGVNTVDLYVKDMEDGGVVRIALAPQRDLPAGEFSLSGNGRFIVAATRDIDGPPTTTVQLISLTGDSPFCEVPDQHPDDGLDPGDFEILLDGLRPRASDVRRAVDALDADSARNPANRAANQKLLAELRAMQSRYRASASAAADDELSKLVDDAKCTLLDDARSNLEDYLRDHGHGDKLELADRFSTIRDVLKGDATDAEKLKLLEDNVTELFQRLAGKDAAKKYSSPIFQSYKLLKADLEGTLDKEVKKELRKKLIAEFKKASKKWFGSDAPELVDRLLDLRDVLSGSVDDKKRAQMLQDSVATLAKKLLGDGILKAPQVRAAMFGFQLGRAFGERIAGDLEFIANKTLAGDCAVALAPSQATPGAIDYSKPASGIVPKGQGLWHAGWRCDVLPEAFVQGTAGGMVQATKPDDAPLKDRLLWRITTTEPVVNYDPSYSR